ncbi:hypothetical protein ACH5AO_01850 [Streptomyces sp. NPDC018964]|uniref:hypothetical protein n=1 Tax=unclassified Streptomyces TaxID=2593676 RepID=UPI0037AF55DF
MEQARTALAERRAGVGDPRALVGGMRRSVLPVPSVGGGPWSARSGGVRWVCASTDEVALARFALPHGPGDRPMGHAALLGARIVDKIVPGPGESAGPAVDIATEDGAMFFPPVTGVVPDTPAVDAEVEGDGHGW